MPSTLRSNRWLAALVWSAALVLARGALAQTAPVIEDVEPTAGPPGTLVYVTGRHFGPTAEVSLGTRPLPTEHRLPNRISVRIPDGASSGAIAVRTGTGSVRGPVFRVTPRPPAPVIDAIAPSSGPPGASVVIQGRNFSPRLADNIVTLGERPVVVRSATPQQLEVTVPEGARSAPFVIHVEQAGEVSSDTPFHVSAATAVDAVSPERAVPGSELRIRGQGFATDPAKNRVFLASVPLAVKRASEHELVVALPAKIASGELLVDVQGGGRATASSPVLVQLRPTIVSFSPRRGPPGTTITVHGTNFGLEPSTIEAKLGEAKLLVRSATATTLELEVPADAQSARLSVRVFGVGPAWSDRPFTVVTPPGAVKAKAKNAD